MATTPLSGGGSKLGKDPSIKSSEGKIVQEAVNRANLKAQASQNSSIKGLFTAVQQMVHVWSPEDKMNIIAAYGNTHNIPKSPTEVQLDNEVTMTLISNLKREDLKKLVGTQEAHERSLLNDVYNNNALTKEKNKKYFNRNTFNQFASKKELEKVVDPKKQLDLLKRYDSDFTVDKKITSSYPALRKELSKILMSYEDKNIASTAVATGVDFEDGIAKKTLVDRIIGRCLLYVSLVIGKGKNSGISHSSVTGDEEKAICDLLRMTSFAWVTGRSGLTDKSIYAKRKAAMEAKRKMKAAEKIATAANGFRKSKKSGKKGEIKFNKAGVAKHKLWGSKKWKEAFERIKTSQVYSDLDDDRLTQLAIAKGIPEDSIFLDPNDPKYAENRNNLLNKVWSIAAEEAVKINAAQDKYDAAKYQLTTKGASRKRIKKYNAAKADYKAELSASTYNFDTAAAAGPAGETSDKIPVVTLNESGNITSSLIAQAVPVVVLGTTHGGTFAKNKEFNDQSDTTEDRYKAAFGYTGNRTPILNRNTRVDVVTGSALSSKLTNPGESINQLTGTGGGSGQDSKTTATGTITLSGPKMKEVIAGSKTAKIQGISEFEENGLKRSMSNGYISLNNTAIKRTLTPAVKKAIAGTRNKIDMADIKGVYVLNKGLDDSTYLSNIDNNIASISGNFGNLYTALMGLQQFGMAANTMAATTMVAKVTNTVQNSLAAAANSLSQHATGSTMKGGSKVSTIVTGDHPQGLNNTEFVSVDWGSKSINVRPVPKMATGGTVNSTTANSNSNVSNVQRMTVGERNQPLSVGIKTGLVKINKTFNDAEDDGSGTAIKVYSVNNSLNEKVKIGDTEVSLIDLVYGIYGSINNMAQNTATNTQLLSVIATNTANTSSNTATIAANSSSGGSFEFPTDLDSILSGR